MFLYNIVLKAGYPFFKAQRKGRGSWGFSSDLGFEFEATFLSLDEMIGY